MNHLKPLKTYLREPSETFNPLNPLKPHMRELFEVHKFTESFEALPDRTIEPFEPFGNLMTRPFELFEPFETLPKRTL